MWTHRAKQEALRAGEVGDKHAVPVNSYVDVHLRDVPSEKAQSIVERVTLANEVSRVLQAIALSASCFAAWRHLRRRGQSIISMQRLMNQCIAL